MEPCCIYCKNPFGVTKPSKSDIIPYFLGNALTLDNAVCKACNNKINLEIEMPLRDHFQYLRKGLDIRGRHRNPLRLVAGVEIEGLNKKMTVNYEKVKGRGLDPFKFIGDDGREYYAAIGSQQYLTKIKKEISAKNPRVKWHTVKGGGEVVFTVTALPTRTMYGHLGRRLAAKVAFERLCQIKSPLIALDGIYDDIRQFILTGVESRTISTLMYDEIIMKMNLRDLPFPCHCIVLSHDLKRNHIVGVVSLFGLYYYLVRIAEYLPIKALWDDIVTVDPQERTEYVPPLRGTLGIRIPAAAWIMNESKLKLAGEFAYQKFTTALESKAWIIGSDS